MNFIEITTKAKELLEESKFDTHEGNITDEVWSKKIHTYIQACLQFKSLITKKLNSFNPPSSHFLIFIGGIIGNYGTSSKLHPNGKLKLLANDLLDTLFTICDVKSVRDLLLLEPVKSSKPTSSNLAIQILRICVTHLTRDSSESKDDPITYCPLMRDALVWIACELDYPELVGEEFVPVLQPFGLRLTEDYRPCIQLSGLRLLRDLASKTRIADWRYSNRALAVISQLLEHRIACSSGSSEILLDEVYLTVFVLVSLLDRSTAKVWYDKIIERILFDLSMETRKSRQHVLLRHLVNVMEIMKASFALHTRKFIETISNILLGPLTPSNMATHLVHNDQTTDDEAVYLLMLQCIYKFIQFVWPLVSPHLLSSMIPPLVTFVDLKSNEQTSWDLIGNGDIALLLSKIFELFIKLEPCVLTKVFEPLFETVPDLKRLLPK